jgi:hypothetical protein
MIQYQKILNDEDCTFFLQNEKVLSFKNFNKKIFYFELPSNIKSKIENFFSISIPQRIPMMWILNDTVSHIDKDMYGNSSTSYLIYVTNSTGNLYIDDIPYDISKGYALSFPENKNHYTKNASQRLLIGPFNSKGLPVGIGGITGTGTVYVRTSIQDGQYDYYYSLDGINYIQFWFPIYTYNTDINQKLIIKFVKGPNEEPFTISSENDYFMCGSENIQFGSETLESDGNRAIILSKQNINTVYPGLIRNGLDGVSGYSNIYVYNLDIDLTGFQYIQASIGQNYFSSGSTCYILNCTSNGIIQPSSEGYGGIVGQYSADNAGSLYITGCSFTGTISSSCGGIVGSYICKSNGGLISCKSCWTTSSIGNSGGGIFGSYMISSILTNNASCIAENCYSNGSISANAGGIFGSFCATVNNSSCVANKCYSTGNIGNSAGGIFGSSCGGTFPNVAEVTYSYSTGNLGTSAGGIFGANAQQYCIATSCYVLSNAIFGSTSSSPSQEDCFIEDGLWNTSNALNTLGNEYWIETGINQPFELLEMGYTPYTLNNIIIQRSIPELNTLFSIECKTGETTQQGVKQGSYYLVSEEKNFIINESTGAITIGNNTPDGQYNLLIRNTGSYNYSTLIITINSAPAPYLPCLMEDSFVLTEKGYINILNLSIGDFVITDDNRKVKIKNIIKTTSFSSKNYPCFIPANSIGKNSEFKISQTHLIKKYGIWILPKDHYKIIPVKNMEYYHIELENYITDNLVINNGVIVESFGRTIFHALEYSKRLGTNAYLLLEKIV